MSGKRSHKRKVSFASKHHLELGEVYPANEKQRWVLSDDRNQVLCGSAGTGKTFLSSYLGYKGIIDGQYNKMLYVRSAVPTRDIGFLPGNEEEKCKIYELPYKAIASQLFGRADAYEVLKRSSTVDFITTSFLRGITIEDSILVVDECQNMSYHELDTIITRIGDNCKIFFCGDIAQADLTKNGFRDFYKILGSMEEFSFTEFETSDIVRSGLVRSYLTKKNKALNIA